MTHFRITFEATCPSDWTPEKAKTWVSKLLCDNEVETVHVEELDPHDR